MEARFVYQAFDLTGEYGWVYDQTLYSILSLMATHRWEAVPPGVTVTVYCDDPQKLQPLTDLLDVQILSPAGILTGMGDQRFIHRLKLDLLLQATTDSTVPLIYFDGDVWFRDKLDHHVAAIAPGRSLMHAQEDPFWQSRNATMRQMRTSLIGGQRGSLTVPKNVVMYNAGVIGLHPADFGLLEEALAFTDRAVKIGYCHIWEQLGVSIALGQATQITAVDDVVHHYWNQREAYSEEIARCLGQIRKLELSPQAAIQHVQSHPVNVPPYQPISLLHRAWRKATGRSKMVAIRMQESVSGVKTAKSG